MGKACPFSSFAIQNLIKIAIFKIMVLHNTLVAKLSRSCYIGDKGVYKKVLLITVL